MSLPKSVPFCACWICNICAPKNSLQAEAGRGTCPFARRETWRPESRLAWQPCWVYATVHQVLCDDQSEVEDEDGGCQVPAIIGYCYFWKLKITMKTWIACSLFMEFTISETFSYFGRLLHMTRDQVAVFTHSHDSLNILLKGFKQTQINFENLSTFLPAIDVFIPHQSC